MIICDVATSATAYMNLGMRRTSCRTRAAIVPQANWSINPNLTGLKFGLSPKTITPARLEANGYRLASAP